MRLLLSVAAAFASLPALPSGAQTGGMDMAAMQKWSSAKVVRYRVEGVHSARTQVVKGDYEGRGDVTDRLTVEFTWDVRKRSIVEPVAVKDGKTELGNVKSDGTKCPPPQLNGEYEHFQSVSHSVTSRDQVQITGTRTYPPGSVSNYPASCSMRAVPGAREEVIVWVAGVAPEVLGMPVTPKGPVTVSADRKSFSVKGASNWVWTYTPTLVQ